MRNAPPNDPSRLNAWGLIAGHLQTLLDARVIVRPDGARLRPLETGWTAGAREEPLRLLKQYLFGLSVPAEIAIYPARDRRHRTRMDWPGPAELFPQAEVDQTGAPFGATFATIEVEAEVVEEGPTTAEEAPALPLPVAESAPNRHFSARCGRDVIALLEDVESWLTGQAISDEFSVRNLEWSPSTIAHALAELVRRGELLNRRGQGYGLPAWEQEE